jgi:hypothetical protein
MLMPALTKVKLCECQEYQTLNCGFGAHHQVFNPLFFLYPVIAVVSLYQPKVK